MLTINLLPAGVRKASLSPVEQLHRTPLMWIVVTTLVALGCLAWMPIPFRQRQLAQLTANIQVLAPKKQALDQVQQALQRLRSQETAFRGLGQGQRMWSKRLNILSDALPEGVWLTDLALDQAKGLVIQGSAIGQGDPQMTSVTRFVHDLQTDQNFASAMKDISIESIKRVPEGEIEIVQFTLTCSIAEKPAS